MEAYTLVIWCWSAQQPTSTARRASTKSSTTALAAGMVKPKQAKCVREDLDRSRAPLCHGYSCPPMSAQPVICGYFGGCWQGGWRLKSAMLGLFQDNP